jgi:hypothetical protein
MYVGIGDAVTVGLAAIDQLLQHDPAACGQIDVLCNTMQAELFAHDPRVGRIFEASRLLFPPPEITAWLKDLLPRRAAAHLIQQLHDQHYTAVVSGMFAPGLYARLHAPVIAPRPLDLWQDWRALHHLQDRPMSKIVRRAVSRYFGAPLSFDALSETIPLYLPSPLLQRAQAAVRCMYERAGIAPQDGKLLLVATDTASDVTRPPVALLVQALTTALARHQRWLVCILPAYTCPASAHELYQQLAAQYAQRVLLLAAEPRATLLETTALIDQAEMFVTGDTGVMHLAATEKRLGSDDTGGSAPRNATRIIALFGGTNPALYGYSRRSIIVGRGRKEQRAYRPGIAKESYRVHGHDLFDHIAPEDITQVLEGADCPDRGHSDDDVCHRYRDPPLPVLGHLHMDTIL